MHRWRIIFTTECSRLSVKLLRKTSRWGCRWSVPQPFSPSFLFWCFVSSRALPVEIAASVPGLLEARVKICPSVSLSVCLSVWLSVCLFVLSQWAENRKSTWCACIAETSRHSPLKSLGSPLMGQACDKLPQRLLTCIGTSFFWRFFFFFFFSSIWLSSPSIIVASYCRFVSRCYSISRVAHRPCFSLSLSLPPSLRALSVSFLCASSLHSSFRKRFASNRNEKKSLASALFCAVVAIATVTGLHFVATS